MDSKKTTKKAAKKNGNGNKTLGKAALKAALADANKKAEAELKAKTKKVVKATKGKMVKVNQPDVPEAGAYTVEGPINGAGAVSSIKDTPGPRFLFSIPSQHTGDNDYEHLVIAKTPDQAALILADARITEKQPQLAENPEARAQLLVIASKNYLHRLPKQIEPRTEPIGVLQINHHKLGMSSPEVN